MPKTIDAIPNVAALLEAAKYDGFILSDSKKVELGMACTNAFARCIYKLFCSASKRNDIYIHKIEKLLQKEQYSYIEEQAKTHLWLKSGVLSSLEKSKSIPQRYEATNACARAVYKLVQIEQNNNISSDFSNSVYNSLSNLDLCNPEILSPTQIIQTMQTCLGEYSKLSKNTNDLTVAKIVSQYVLNTAKKSVEFSDSEWSQVSSHFNRLNVEGKILLHTKQGIKSFGALVDVIAESFRNIHKEASVDVKSTLPMEGPHERQNQGNVQGNSQVRRINQNAPMQSTKKAQTPETVYQRISKFLQKLIGTAAATESARESPLSSKQLQAPVIQIESLRFQAIEHAFKNYEQKAIVREGPASGLDGQLTAEVVEFSNSLANEPECLFRVAAPIVSALLDAPDGKSISTMILNPSFQKSVIPVDTSEIMPFLSELSKDFKEVAASEKAVLPADLIKTCFKKAIHDVRELLSHILEYKDADQSVIEFALSDKKYSPFAKHFMQPIMQLFIIQKLEPSDKKKARVLAELKEARSDISDLINKPLWALTAYIGYKVNYGKSLSAFKKTPNFTSNVVFVIEQLRKNGVLKHIETLLGHFQKYCIESNSDLIEKHLSDCQESAGALLQLVEQALDTCDFHETVKKNSGLAIG